MKYRLPEIEVPADDPFKHDALGREPVVGFLANLIGRLEGPFVLALDSPWGTGKTTVVKMLQAQLSRDEIRSIYFNAWKVDYVSDPLIALVASLDEIQLTDQNADSVFRGHLKIAKKITSAFAKRAIVAAVKGATMGVLDIPENFEKIGSEAAGEMAGDAVEIFKQEKKDLETFRKAIGSAVEQLKAENKKETLVFFVDELDRCRPTFAIEMLERIKHLFDMPNIVFVLSVDKAQLEAITAAVYGAKINAPEYLRRFIDLEYSLPIVQGEKYTEKLLKQFNLNEIFAQRNHPDLAGDQQEFVSFFSLLADAASLSLRVRERCMTKLVVAMEKTPNNRFLHPTLIALLIVLRLTRPDLFGELRRGAASAEQVMAYINSLPGGPQIVSSWQGEILEIGLVLADENEKRREQTLKKLDEDAQFYKTGQTAGRSARLLAKKDFFGRYEDQWPRLGQLLDKIDLTAGLSN